MTGRADFLRLGDWNANCYYCGRKRKASDMRKMWKGFWVCKEEWEPRQPQDFAHGVPDIMTPPWQQPPPADEFVKVCTPNGISAIAGQAVAGCAVAGYISPAYIPPQSQCTLPGRTGIAGLAVSGCSVSGRN